MKVTLNIENDAELRAHIKDAIKGQVLSVIRDEFKAIITEELTRIFKGIDARTFDNQLKKSMTEAISEILVTSHNVIDWNNAFIEPFVNKKLDQALGRTDWNKLVDTLAKEKVKALIK